MWSIFQKKYFDKSNIESIEFPKESKIQIIKEKVLYGSSIRIIKIPSEVTIIKKHAFYFCEQIRQIEFSSDYKLQTIGESAFFGISIDSITIPSKATDLKEGWCYGTFNVSKINVMLSIAVYMNE